jgi:hypothetical protein
MLLASFISSPDRESNLNPLGTQETTPSPSQTSVASGITPLEELLPRKICLVPFVGV